MLSLLDWMKFMEALLRSKKVEIWEENLDVDETVVVEYKIGYSLARSVSNEFCYG